MGECSIEAGMNKKEREYTLRKFVNKSLFCHLKFVLSIDDLMQIEEPGSMSLFVV